MPARAAKDPLVLLMERARKDPRFFHQLVFDPEKTLAKVPFLSRQAKARLLAIRPENVIQLIIGKGSTCGDPTCGSGSCGTTCGALSCDQTCASSCGPTCASSCGKTTDKELPGSEVETPGSILVGTGVRATAAAAARGIAARKVLSSR